MFRNFFPKLGMAVKIVEVTVIRLRGTITMKETFT